MQTWLMLLVFIAAAPRNKEAPWVAVCANKFATLVGTLENGTVTDNTDAAKLKAMRKQAASLSWHALTPQGESSALAGGIFSRAKVITLNDGNTHRLLLGPCAQEGTLYASAPMSALEALDANAAWPKQVAYVDQFVKPGKVNADKVPSKRLRTRVIPFAQTSEWIGLRVDYARVGAKTTPGNIDPHMSISYTAWAVLAKREPADGSPSGLHYVDEPAGLRFNRAQVGDHRLQVVLESSDTEVQTTCIVDGPSQEAHLTTQLLFIGGC